MTVRREWLNWGIFLIALGSVPLAVYWNMIDASVAQELLRLWPLILIGIGIGLILRFTRLAFLGGLLTAAVFGLLIGSVIAGGWRGGIPVAGCAGPASAATETRTSPAAGPRHELDLELSCVELAVSDAQADEWVVRADFSGDRFRLDQQAARLSLRDADRGFLGGTTRRAVEIGLPTSPDDGVAADVTLNASAGTFSPGNKRLNGLGFTLNASDMSFDLSQATLDAGLGMTLNASSATLILPASGSDSSVGLTLNASSLTLCVPPELDLDVRMSETLSSNNFAEAGLTRSGETWHVDGSGTGRLTLSYTGNVSSITLDRSGGCE